MKRFFKIFLLVVILGVFIFTIYFLYNKSQAKPVLFETAQATVTHIIKKTVATGSVIPRKEIEIKPKISGIIEELYVEPGNMIKKGDLIARVKIIPNMVNLNNAESRLNRARIALQNAEINFNRQRELYEKKIIPKSEFESFDLAYKNAREEVASAENNLELIREGQTRQQNETSNTLITSTIEGMVLDVPIEIGNSVIESNTFNDGTTVAIIADMGEMIFKGKVDESEVGKIREGMNLILHVGALENVDFHATLEHISPKGVEENGAIQFEIKAAVSLIDSLFVRAGYSANADIVLDRRDSVLAISESLLKFDGDSSFVEIETGPQVFEKRYIQTGLSDGINIEVISGLTTEDKIKKQN
ncbi:MAG: efflux RND transporter periplasmic adaptor subunit [Bacteroidales bacterium]|nr:efflux RND transporter periplasmic adaptor subunit [Bacteroidales bacterium]